jgi:type VI secretion system protein ImpC
MPREPLQQKLDRVRAPRAYITYEVPIGAAIRMKEIPFVVGVLAELSGKPDEPLPLLRDSKFIEIDWDNFNSVLAAMRPRLAFTVDNLLAGGGQQLAIELRFYHMDDFEPVQVIGQVKPLQDLLEMRQQLAEGRVTVVGNDLEIAAVGSLPLQQVNLLIHAIDNLLSRQLSLIMHASEFQKLEASWRGLHYLVQHTETSTMLKIRVLNVSKRDLLRDQERAPEFDQSALFKKVYEEAYGTFDGVPFGVLIGDYEFGHHPQDISLLEKLSNVAAAAHTPFIAAANPQLFNLDSFTELGIPRDLAKIIDSVEYARWKSFRQSEDSRYIGLTIPRILLRLPYTPRPAPVETFQFTEDVDATGRLFLWGNTAFAFGACLTNAFAKYAWCAAIRGVEGGGLVEGLPTWTFKTDEGDMARKCSTEIAITDRREKELADLGFIPLLSMQGTDTAAFFSAPSCQQPRKYDADAANVNSRLAAQLQCVMTTSRFAHYLKSIMRDQLGSFMSRGDCESFLNRWILNYVLLDDDASLATKARYPLREARINVSEMRGKPGVYLAVVYLRPHFQLEELTVSLRLVIELLTPASH